MTTTRRQAVAGLLTLLAASTSGCHCGSGEELGGNVPVLCVSTVDDATCIEDGALLDWGHVAVGEQASIELRVMNQGRAPLSIHDVVVTNDSGHGELFSVALCDVNECDEGNGVALSDVLEPAHSRILKLTFDAIDIDGEVPVERLMISHNDASDTLEPKGIYVRTFAGVIDGCREGYADANGEVSDGCECELSAIAGEVCDGVDNDCNGLVDDAVPGSGIPCDTGLEGICAKGETGCTNGTFGCVPTMATTETCDGEDNDCDGAVDEEGSWAPYDDGLSGGFMSDVAFDERHAGVAYAVTGTHIYRSGDAGATFGLMGEAPYTLRMLAFPPNDMEAILAASDGGLLRSEDDGETWNLVSLTGLPLFSLFIHPADPARIFAGTTGAGIYRSTNGGASFAPVNQGVPYSRVTDFAGDPTNSGTVVAMVQILNAQNVQSTSGQILRTTNGGANWTPALDNVGLGFAITRCASDKNLLYAAIFGTGVAESLDGGASWGIVGLNGLSASEVELSPTDCTRLYASAHPDGMYRSDDGAQTFNGPLANGMDVQFPGLLKLAVDPMDDNRILGANHSGVFLSTNAGGSWVRVQQISAASVRALAVRPSEPAKLWMSTWGQGPWVRDTPQTSWNKIPATALPQDWAFTIAPDPNDTSRVIVGGWPTMWLSTDGGGSFTSTGVTSNVQAIGYHPSDPLTILAVSQLGGVIKSSDGGSSWNPSNVGLPAPWPSGVCTCRDTRDVLFDDSVSDTVYIATAGQGIFRSDDAGATWLTVAPELAGQATGCLMQDQGVLYACAGGSGIWTSTDSAASFSPLTQGNPELSNVSGILADDATGNLYATSDAGVFRSVDDGMMWDGMDNRCLPTKAVGNPVIVEHQGMRLLVISTTLAGVWALPL